MYLKNLGLPHVLLQFIQTINAIMKSEITHLLKDQRHIQHFSWFPSTNALMFRFIELCSYNSQQDSVNKLQ